MRKTFYFIPLIIFLTIVLLLWRGLQQNPSVIPTPLLNKPLPPISSPSLDDDPPMKVTNQVFLDHITLLNVWASWCAACQTERPMLMDIARSGKVVIYGLNYKDRREVALDQLKKMGNPYVLNIYDPKGEVGLNLGVYGTPETFLIDQNGIIRYKYIGPITSEVWQTDLLPRIEKLQNQ